MYSPGGTDLGVSGDSSESDGLVEDSLATAGGSTGLEQQQAGQLLLGQLGDGSGGDLAEVPLAAVVGVHGGDRVENELLSDGDFILNGTLSTAGNGSEGGSGLDGQQKASKASQSSCADSQTSDGCNSFKIKSIISYVFLEVDFSL